VSAPVAGANSNTLKLTFSGIAFYLFAGSVDSSGALATTLPVFQVNKLEIVLWTVNYGASFRSVMGEKAAVNKLHVRTL
jgi:hypothetical protein